MVFGDGLQRPFHGLVNQRFVRLLFAFFLPDPEGFQEGSPVQHASLKFAGAGYARTGMGISLLAWALALAFGARIFATRKSRDFFKQWGGGET